MTALQLGNRTEIEVQYLLVKKGYNVFTPITDGCSVDLCFSENNEIKKVQVKTSHKTGAGFAIHLLKGSKNKEKYSSIEVDYFATTYENKLYLIPFMDVDSKAKLTLMMDGKSYHSCPEATKYLIT